VAREIAPFLGHELNAALYRYDALSATLMAIFTRHRSERPGALAVRMVGWNELITEYTNDTTASISSDYPGWPVTTYDQLSSADTSPSIALRWNSELFFRVLDW